MNRVPREGSVVFIFGKNEEKPIKKVATLGDDLEKPIVWLGWRDSNPRMTGPEPVALPLGDTPVSRKIILR